jgi:hypothetical protein
LSGPVFIFCSPALIFDGTESIASSFLVLRSRARFRWYRGRRVPFSCFALSGSFPAVLGAPSPLFMFCAPELIFSGTEGVRSHFQVLRSRTHFRRYRGRRVPFSSFALLDPFRTELRAPSLVFMFCAPGLVFKGTEGVGSYFYVLRSRTSCPVFMFSAPELVFDGTEGVESGFQVLRSWTRFGQN